MKFRAFLLAIVALAPVGALAQGVIPTNNPTIFSQQPVQATGSTTPRTLATRAADVMHAADWGVVCDGSTDNASAISNMMTNEPATGATIIFPPGTCVTSGQISIGISGTTIEGAAGSPATTLSRPAANANAMIYINSSSVTNVTVKNLTLKETGTPASNDYAMFTEGAYDDFEGLTVTGFGGGLYNGSNSSLYKNNSITVPNISGAVGITETSSAGQNIFYNNTISGSHILPEYSVGIYVTAGSADEFIFNELLALNIAMEVVPPSTNSVYSLIIISDWFDHSNSNGLLLNATSGGSIARVTITDSWFSSTYSGPGLQIEGNVVGLHIAGSEFYLNSGDGVNIAASSNVQSFLLENSMMAQNGGSGINVGNSVSDVSIIGNVMGPTAAFTGNAYPYYITGPTNNNIIISGNNTIGNTNGPFNGSTGTGITIIGNNDTLGNQLQGGLTVNGIALATTPNVATLGTNPPVSGTAYQWAGPGTLQLACPITLNPTSTAAASVSLAIGSSSTLGSTMDAFSLPSGATALAGMTETEKTEVPSGWYYGLTATNATIGTCAAVVH